MSLDYSGYQPRPWTGPITASNVKIATADPIAQAIKLPVKWVNYTNMAITVNLQQGGSLASFSAILSVIIDNQNNTHAIAVVFPDTGYEVICPAGATRAMNVITNGLNAVIYSLFPSVSSIGTTDVYFLNYPQAPDLDGPVNLVGILEQGRDNQNSAGIPNMRRAILADIVYCPAAFALNPVLRDIPMCTNANHGQATPVLNASFIIKFMKFRVKNLYNVLNPLEITCFVSPLGYPAFDNYFTFSFIAPTDTSAMQEQTVFEASDMFEQIVFTGGATSPRFSTDVAPDSGEIQLLIGFTYTANT